jgi:multidrug efflux pump subunit AcrA (membrane-fusion protein)
MSGASDDHDPNDPDQFGPPADLDPPSTNWLFDERNRDRLHGMYVDGAEQDILAIRRQQRELAAQQTETAKQQARTAQTLAEIEQRQAETAQQQRTTMEQLAGLNLLVQLLPAVRGKKTRGEALATSFARIMRETLLERGDTPQQTDEAVLVTVTKALGVTLEPEAARAFLKRLGMRD